MNKKYQKYINYIVSDIKPPYFINMEDHYGLKDNEYPLILLNIFNEPVTITSNDVYDVNGNRIYYENSNGSWVKREYDNNGDNIYYEDSSGYWVKYKYDNNGKVIYYETSDGVIIDYR